MLTVKSKLLKAVQVLSLVFMFLSCNSDGPFTGQLISAKDTPFGYASAGIYVRYGKSVEVNSKSELVSALKSNDACIIYLNKMIDLSEGMCPSSAGGSTDKLDAFVSSGSSYKCYGDLKKAYASACRKSTDDKYSSSPSTAEGKTVWDLNMRYQDSVVIKLGRSNSNKTLIGTSCDAGIKGGSIVISGASNIIIRNITVCDAYDPFPHHESKDGFNAELDGICIQDGSKNVWIDHCTFFDSMKKSSVKLGDGTYEPWQTYDGLLDIKGNGTTNITVSSCRFMNHDKTMLMGSSASDGKTDTRYATLFGNYFENCGQRLPMARNFNIHMVNNVFDSNPSAPYGQQYAIGAKDGSKIIAENNYFGSGIKYSLIADSTGRAGKVYFGPGNVDVSSKRIKTKTITPVERKPFDVSYKLSVGDIKSELENIKMNAGSGCVVSK